MNLSYTHSKKEYTNRQPVGRILESDACSKNKMLMFFGLNGQMSDSRILPTHLRRSDRYPVLQRAQARGFGFEVQLSLTKKGQYAVAYCLS